MSGWIGRNWPRWFAKISYSRVPTAAKTAVDQIDAQWDKMAGKPGSIPTEQHPTMPQAQVNQEFRKKEQRVRNQGFGKR